MRIAITGGRSRVPTEAELMAFMWLFKRLGGTVLLHGNARGTDKAVAKYAKARGVEVVPFDVDTHIDGPWPAAGHRRNWRMLSEGLAGALIAFKGERGTTGCIKAAKSQGLLLRHVRLRA